MSKSFTPKVDAKKTRTTDRKSTSKVSAKKAHPTHRKPTSQVAAEKASNTHRKETPKVATETVRGTHRKVAAKFQEFRARKVAAKFQEFRALEKPHDMPAFAEGGLNEFRAIAVPYPMPASAKGRVQIEEAAGSFLHSGLSRSPSLHEGTGSGQSPPQACGPQSGGVIARRPRDRYALANSAAAILRRAL
jgi:hypothetical protein